jgi:hypothetical protein
MDSDKPRVSWQDEERQENARRREAQAEPLRKQAEWIMSGEPDPLELMGRIDEVLDFVAERSWHCLYCGAKLFLVRSVDGFARVYGRDAERHWLICEGFREADEETRAGGENLSK